MTHDPIPDRDDGSRDISKILGEREREELYEQTLANPIDAIPALEALLEKHPDVPTLYNWLATCCMRGGRQERGVEVIRLNFERNPNYLFARLNYAELCLRAHAPEVAATVMEGKWDLKALYPARDVFHVTEFVGMSTIAIEYFMQTGGRETAELLLASLKQVAPRHDATAAMTRRVEGSPLMKALRAASPFAAKSGAIAEDLLDLKD